jgi:hypothetical protein
MCIVGISVERALVEEGDRRFMPYERQRLHDKARGSSIGMRKVHRVQENQKDGE